MSFWLGRDYFNNPIIPSYILCKANKERIGTILCTSKNITVNFNNLDEIQFDTYLYVDNELNKYYEDIDIMKYILLPDIGFYSITSVDIQSKGTRLEYKSITAKSSECLLGQKYLETFSINIGTVESIDGVKFYDIGHPEKSLLHLVLEKFPDWKIGYVDVALQTMERSFQIDRQDVYSFLTVDVSAAFGCLFLFDSLNNTINIYKEENVGKDTNVYVSYNNLLKKTNISCNIDNIKTCLTLIGADDLNIREINLGYDRIYNLDFYNSTKYMSKSLHTSWNLWTEKRSGYLDEYTTLLSQYEDYYAQINELTHNKMPDDTDSVNWTEYGLVPLQEKLATYEQQQSVMMKSGQGDENNKDYQTKYLPVYNTINSIKNQIAVVENEIKELQSKQDVIYSQMSVIINDLSMNNNFTSEQLKELSSFIREDELSSDNYVITDTMTDEERFAMLHDFLDYGEKELVKIATPQLSFSADMINLFAIPEFEIWNDDFEPSNYIHISLRDDYIVKARLLSVSLNFLDVTDFNVTFGNVVKRSDGGLLDVTEAIALAQSAATSVSMNASNWDRSAKDTSEIGKMLDEGLLNAGKYLKSGDDSEMIIDSRGIFVNTTSGQYANKDSVFVGGGRILFTDNNWETVSMSVGRADVTIRGKTQSRFGTFADFVIAGYVGGATVEGTEIYGGTITGTVFNNGNGTFLVDKDGNLTATSATIKGKIQADTGYIGGENGFIITTGKLYSGKNTFNNSSDGVYLGTDGIALGKDNAFSVDVNGNLIAKTGTIGGIKIDSSRIYSDNGKLEITSAGYGRFEDIMLNGVRAGSSFGSIGYNNGITWGSFGGSSYFGSNVGSPFSGTCIDHIEEISADYIYANYLQAMNAEIDNLWTKSANIETLIANEISATNATINSLTSKTATIDGKITALQGDFDSLRSGSTSFSKVSTSSIQMYSGSSPISMGVVTIVDSLGNSYKVVGTAI